MERLRLNGGDQRLETRWRILRDQLKARAAPASGTGPGTAAETCSTVNCANCTDLDAVTLVVNMRDVAIGASAAAMNWLLNGVRMSSGKEVWVKVLES